MGLKDFSQAVQNHKKLSAGRYPHQRADVILLCVATSQIDERSIGQWVRQECFFQSRLPMEVGEVSVEHVRLPSS